MVTERGPIDGFIILTDTDPYEPFDEELLSALTPSCRIIASASAGYNEFDVGWMTSRNMWFCNTVDGVAEATADLAMFLVLAVLRDAFRAERGARDGSWKRNLVPFPTNDPTGLTLGIVGMGSIGKYLAKKAAVFNMRIRYYNRTRLPADTESRYSATYCSSLHELLGQSDVVSVSCPLTKETTGMISSKEFDAMKTGAYLVNVSRGAVVDEAALIDALESGKVTRAGLDVFSGEPNINEYFKTSDKVVCLPHIGASTVSASKRAEMECFENIKACFKKGRPAAPVNLVSDVVLDSRP